MPPGENAQRAVDAAGYTVGLALAALAAVRRGKAVHPHGAAPNALDGTQLFPTEDRRQALARFSRSLGLPRPLPDLLGMSVRAPDAYGVGRHQDFLMV